MAKITVDNREIEAEIGTSLLQACLDNGIYIPNLCFLKEMKRPSASCRLCFVEIEGTSGPVTSCTTPVSEGMVVTTNTEVVRRLQKSVFRLILSNHHSECKNCPANKNCELQNIAKFLGVGLKLKRLDRCPEPEIVEEEHQVLALDHLRCVLCGRCVAVCSMKHPRTYLAFAKRGLDTYVSHYGGENVPNLPCRDCLACIDVCPVKAISRRESVETAAAVSI